MLRPSQPSPRRAACVAALSVVVGVVVVTLSAAVGLTGASASTSAAAVTPGSDYLALGDSVSFGYREPTNLPTPDYTRARTFTGWPEDVAASLGLDLANASCPGETSASLLTAGVTSNGCENSASTPYGYRSVFPLHVRYGGTQLAYGLRYLRNHPDTRLVSLMIGANDGFLCQSTTTDHCRSELPGVLAGVRSNVAKTLGAVRGTGYDGQIVILNYYSLDYTSAVDNLSSLTVNAAMDTAAKPYDVEVADGYGAFRAAAAQAGGDSCAAGLLTTLSAGGCGVHPSVAGQALLALAVAKAIGH